MDFYVNICTCNFIFFLAITFLSIDVFLVLDEKC